ncbi:hypothetical protein [Bradyrhizobium sp. SZCCHNS3053]|uniref:hypothetical protein n=1 Tax=Bradyrhizobium sp. SZCCHNS3053 TaxID=3057322 RepID=UPI002915D84C|nr:hypothetical protein [Bradyrhizobium sp. SZCCHNS3053]
MSVPDELVDLALNTLEEEVSCWRKVPWGPNHVRLTRWPIDRAPGEIPSEIVTVTCHDVPAEMADDILRRIAIEKVLEVVIGAISVGAE